MRLVSPKQLAAAAGVSESSIKRWCDQGLIPTVKTVGGHRRVSTAAAIQFCGRQILQWLPNGSAYPRMKNGELASSGIVEQFTQAILAGNESLCRQIVFDLHLAGESACRIFDNVIAPAFHCVGTGWECDEVQVYQERRGCGICLRVIDELRRMIPLPRNRAPQAIGGSIEGDPYMLPTAMVETVLLQNGWVSQSLGSNLPFDTIRAAVEELQPSLMWLSISHIENERRFLDRYSAFLDSVNPSVPLVVGGRVLTESLRRKMRYTAYCDNLQHLEAFANTLKRSSLASHRSKVAAKERRQRINQPSPKEL